MTATATAAETARDAATAKRDALIDFYSGAFDGEPDAVRALRALAVWTDGPRRVVADVPDISDRITVWARQLTGHVLDDASPAHFDTAVIEQVSDTRAILHLAPLPGEVRG